MCELYFIVYTIVNKEPTCINLGYHIIMDLLEIYMETKSNTERGVSPFFNDFVFRVCSLKGFVKAPFLV